MSSSESHNKEPDGEVLVSVLVTRQEAFLLLVALQNVSVDLGPHERALCAKVRAAWDESRRPHQREQAAERRKRAVPPPGRPTRRRKPPRRQVGIAHG